MGRRTREVRASGGAYVFELPVAKSAEDRVRFGVMKMFRNGVDIVHHVAAGYEQVFPAVVIQIAKSMRPSLSRSPYASPRWGAARVKSAPAAALTSSNCPLPRLRKTAFGSA